MLANLSDMDTLDALLRYVADARRFQRLLPWLISATPRWFLVRYEPSVN